MTRLALAIDAAHPAFAGHFPSRAIVPGVLLLDESRRAIVANFGIGEDRIAATVCRIGVAKFLSAVAPGEPLWLEVEAKVETTATPSADPEAMSASYAMRVFAGHDANRRLAVTGTMSFESRSAQLVRHA